MTGPSLEQKVDALVSTVNVLAEIIDNNSEKQRIQQAFQAETYNLLLDMIMVLIYHSPASVKQNISSALDDRHYQEGTLEIENRPDWFDGSYDQIKSGLGDAAKHGRLDLILERLRGLPLGALLGK
ncbi:hypothetical protein [Gluconobacter cerinus]|uniref:hypothetical protein n=1 Tax=Gluconobacter cerinus TaxID=38307 RepID=UPI001B8D4A4F|nr:hypothetical protein [Gluconobacter cerinus]MBS1035013.1 hypothetical protein [Gluconobacter cerinus]